MITADPQQRVATLARLNEILARESASDDRDLLLAFAPVVYQNMPDSLALALTPEALAARIRGYFRFVARTMPPSFQLYKGLPGLHVAVRNPVSGDDADTRVADRGSQDTTIVETHTPDAPFIFVSLKNYFQKEGLRVFSAIHPIFTVRRQWERVTWIGGPQEDGSRELFCEFRIERVEAREKLRHIEHEVFSVLKAVFLGVEDYPAMLRTISELGGRLRSRRGRADDVDSARAFLEWLRSDNYVLFGMLRYHFGQDGQPHEDQTGALGVFTDPALPPVVFPGLMEQELAQIRLSDADARVIDVDYCANAHAIYHLEPIDDIVVREWRPDGSIAAATLLAGRFSKSALTARPEEVPMVKDKFAWVLEHCGAAPKSHAYRETRAFFNHFPLRELLYADQAALKDTLERLVHVSSDNEIVVTTRSGTAYTAVAVAFSHLRYSHKAEEDLRSRLAEEFGPITFNTRADLGVTTLLLFYFDRATLEHPIDVEKIRLIAAEVISTWEDRVAASLERAFGPLDGRRLLQRYLRSETRSGIYREATNPEEVPGDIVRFEALEAQLETTVSPESADIALLKLYSARPLPLTATLRTLENLALPVRDELAIPLVLPENKRAHLARLRIEAPAAIITAMVEGEERLREALRALQEGRATDDPLNGLIMMEGLTWRDVEVLRTVRNHLLQIRPVLNADTVNGVLLRNSQAAAALYRMFAARFDPTSQGRREATIEERDDAARGALRRVGGLFDDEILRGLENLIRATVRTNAYQRPERPVFSIKVESARVDGMVSPRPLFEIYVHSRKLEGIHLRGGRVARGGLRWSDRHDDFRTEVLGLMNTQMLKNAIIVPVGSKGGFVLKGQLPPRPALDAYLIDRYREFVSGLLDVTDNLIGGEVVHPPEVVRRDADDPYLVVAADKGTAHLSDTANQVSAQYGFWLGDAFASGGSNGYDHKKEAITARGAWECIRHHFRNLGVDVQAEPFTVAAIGDMAGDVFGNGMLRSRQIKLVAAFNHQHIFIDPNPDAERSFIERERLFHLPRSTWMDYDTTTLSPGGGIYERSAKTVPLSAEARAVLALETEDPSGEDVIRHILTANVDLLYNGGVGTYVKASREDDAAVGDRSNDRVRVDASDVRARVVSEGGNLGLTQPARIEYWTRGGLINTDAIDNSGGVDMSDHEVNIKILLDVLLREGLIASRMERNQILGEMTDEVSLLVLADNRNQALALTLDGLRSAGAYDEYVAFVDELIASGITNRTDDAVPLREELLASPARARGLPRPLLAVLMGRVKNWAFANLLKTTFPDSETGRPLLDAYFPKRLRDSFREQLVKHPLRREIVATAAVNAVVNQAGLRFISRMLQTTAGDIGDVVTAYLDVDREAGAEELRAKARASNLSPAREHEALLQIEAALEQGTRDALQDKTGPGARQALRDVASASRG